MATLSWLNLGVCVLLLVECVVLFLDGKGQRRALRAAHRTLAALERQIVAQDQQIGDLSRAVTSLGPPQARSRAARRSLARRSRPREPSAEEVAAARAAHVEAMPIQVLPPVDTTGDRGGINPGDPIPAGDVEPEVQSSGGARRVTLLGGLAAPSPQATHGGDD